MNGSSSSDYGSLFNPPAAPFTGPGGFRASRDNLPMSSTVSFNNNLSLSVIYLPTKSSASPIIPMGAGERNRKKQRAEMNFPKSGGGQDVFKNGEARISGKRMRWNSFGWVLFITNSIFVSRSSSSPPLNLSHSFLVVLTWFDVFLHNDVIHITNHIELALSTIAACIG